MKQLSNRDARLLRADVPHSNVSSTGVYIYDPSTALGGEMSYETILEHIECRLHTSPIFSRKLAQVPLGLDSPYWVEDEHFELEDHVRHVALPKPGDQKQFCTLAARVHSRPLDLSRPLWEIYVVEGLDNIAGLPPGCFALLTKVHHAAIGLMTGAEIMAGLHDPAPDRVPTTGKRPRVPEEDPDALELLLRTSYKYAIAPWRVLRPARRALSWATPEQLKFYGGLLTHPRGIPRTRFNREVSSRRVWETRSYDLAEIRAIKQAVPGTTVHDVVLAICSGALACYLKSKRELPERSVTGLIPVVLDKDYRSRHGGSPVSFFRQKLHTELTDPLQRLCAIAEETATSGHMDHAIDARELADIHQHAPTETLALASRMLTANLAHHAGAPPLAHCCITNVPGPQMPLYFAGARMVYISGVAPLTDGLGLTFLVNTYDGKLRISPTSCREIVPDPEVLAHCIQKSFEALRQTALEPRTRKKPRAVQEVVCVREPPQESARLIEGRYHNSERGARGKKPNLIYTLLETRALLEVASVPLTLPLLHTLPRGDGHPVMVLPGFSADDNNTLWLRYFLRSRGYAVHSWGFRRNLGLAGNIEERVAERVRKLAKRSGRRVSLVGHSMGGLISRYVAHDVPESVRQVITVGSPNGANPSFGDVANLVARMYGAVNPGTLIREKNPHATEDRLQRWRRSPPVPLTAIYTRTDGAAHWTSCLDPEDTECSENVCVPGSHTGMTHNAMVLWVIADRLAQRECEWRPFERRGLHKMIYEALEPLEHIL